MRRVEPRKLVMLALAALALVGGCKDNHDRLAEEAPALARADLKVERIAVAGMVSTDPGLEDSEANRENWSYLLGNQLGRERFGKLPIVDYREVRTAIGSDDWGTMLDAFQHDGRCDTTILADLGAALEGKARFILFGRIEQNKTEQSTSDNFEKKTKIYSTTRTVAVRLHFYDLSDRSLAWDHLAHGSSSTQNEYDNSDLLEDKEGDKFLTTLTKAVVNEIAKPEMTYPASPGIDPCVGNAFDNVGDYLKPPKKKK